ncbi:hypothetical protein GDO81_016386 [Engystomops pustulosus]|uniref:Uncharacterized protein n=1 Tax=Engystomops pustulosus TaxID=76066 RepID=A0AAV7ASM4_ENGPU|nr:hypothetical protein GDO81_016386 [Engystomops pustulosus]
MARITAADSMEAGSRRATAGSGRRSSGLLLNATSAQGGETRVLCEALRKLTAVTRAISSNLRNVNENLERILLDKEDIEELEKMLNALKVQ